MPNAWPCIGPGPTEREPEACSSCLAVVLHEPELVEWFAGKRSFAQVLRDRGSCILRALDSIRPATRAGLAHAFSRTTWRQRGRHGPQKESRHASHAFHPARTSFRDILTRLQGRRVLRALVERCGSCKGRCAASRNYICYMACVVCTSSSPCYQKLLV